MENDNIGRLVHLLKPSCDKFLAVENEIDRENFTSLLEKFNRLYTFLSQVNRNFDVDVQKLYIFSHLLYKILPKREKNSDDITDLLTLEFYKLKQNFSGSIKLKSEDNKKISPITENDTKNKNPDKNSLEKIIQKINLQFGTKFTDADKVLEKILEDFKSDKKAVKCAKENDATMFRTAYQYDTRFENIFYDNLKTGSELEKLIAKNLEILQTLKEAMFPCVYQNLL